MGVHELFKLLEPASEPIKPNELNGKIMAVDISVWMHQFIHGTFLSESDHPDGEDEDKVEHDNIAAYLQKLFLRFCKLWFWGAKIVIVFDGQTPLLKKNTVAKRLKQKRQDEKKLHLVAKKLLKNRLEGFALDRVTTKTTPATARKQRPSGDYLRDEEELDDFALPGYNKRNESSSSIVGEINDSVDEASMSQLSTPDKKKTSSALSESDIYNDPRNWDFGDAAVDIETVFKTPPSTKSSKTVDSVSPNSQNNNDAYDEEEDPVFDYDIEDIDEEVFAKLPASVQQQLLKNMRRLKRRAPATKISTLQTHTPDSFSSTQLSNFIQGRNAHRKLQKIMQDAQEASQLEKHSNLLTPKLEDQLDNMELIGGRLASDENTRFILLTTPEKSADKEQGTRRLTNRSSSQLPASQQSASYSGNDIYDPQDEIVSERVTSIDDRDIQIDFDTPNPSHEARDDQQMLTNDNNGDVIVVEDDNDDDFESVGLNNDDIVMEVDNNNDDDEYESALNTTMDDETIAVDLIARELFPASMFERANVLESDMFPASMFEKPSNIDSSELSRTEEVETVAIDIVETEEEYRITEEEIGSQDTGMQKQRVPVQQQFPLESDVNSIIDNIETIAETSTMSVSRSDEHVESVSPIYTNIEEIIDVEDTEEKPASFTIELDATEEKIDRKGKGHVIDVHETEDRLEREVDISVAPNQHSPVLSEETIREREVMIEQMREQLNSEQQVLRKELNRAKKSTQAISEHLVEKTKALLQALGIPYVESPYEADAQCGYLSQHGLVHGVVSEDSDMLLFGCSVLYRKLFGRDDCQVYSYKNIEERLGLTRRELIQLGMLLGCDYSDGVHGVGIVTGIQICDAFNRLVDAKSSSRKKTLTITDIIDPLQKFAEWVTSKDDMFDDTGGFKFKFRNIKRNFVLPHGFPDERIADAFLNPTVDKSQEEFAFGTFGSDEGEEDMVGLDIQTLHRFGAENMNWSKDTIDHHLNTLVGAYKKKVKQQNSIGPMDYYLSKPTNKNIRSEGIKRAVKGLTFKRKLESQSNSDSLESEEPITKKKRK